MTFRVELDAKRQTETVLVAFDFTSFLNLGETVSTQVTTSSVWSGTDSSPAAMISGASSNASGVISQLITGGLAGVLYLLSCTITTSLGQTLVGSAYMAVKAS